MPEAGDRTGVEMGRGRGGPGRGLGYGPGKRSPALRALAAQRDEITEHHIYKRLAQTLPEGGNRRVVEQLARDERKHYGIWKEITSREVEPSWWKVRLYAWLTRLLGLSFGLRLMERGETMSRGVYDQLQSDFPRVAEMIQDEQRHEEKLLGMINEKVLAYAGSIVLGLSDAIVELTGVLAGLTLALGETKLIAMVGFITGFAAALSMGASEYLSTKEEGADRHPLRAGLITGFTYLAVVLLLISVYFLFDSAFAALAAALGLAVIIISAFTFYTAVARKLSFKKRFLEMAAISLGVAAINFVIGLVIKQYFNV